MKVISVINYKGGVGKTTVTANLGAMLARHGRRILLLDLDPQSSLTFSFYTTDEWKADLQDSRTIKRWFDSFEDGSPSVSLADLVLAPRPVSDRLGGSHGELHLVASHLKLIDVDQEIASDLGGSSARQFRSKFVRVYRRLAMGLADAALSKYDFVLVDCAPNFNLVTKTAIVASDAILIPAKPDHLSTLGIRYLKERVAQLKDEYNEIAAQTLPSAPGIDPHVMGVVFTMVRYNRGAPQIDQKRQIDKVRREDGPIFGTPLREKVTLYARASKEHTPAALLPSVGPDISYEYEQLANDFLERIDSVKGSYNA